MIEQPPAQGPPPPAQGNGGPAKQRSDSSLRFWRAIGVAGKVALGIFAVAIAFGLAHYGYDYLKSMNSDKKEASEYSEISAATLQEWQLARSDHEIIASAVAACSKIFNLKAEPDFARAELRLDIMPNGSPGFPYHEGQVKGESTLMLSNFQRAVIFLSDSIARARVESATSANLNYSSMFWFQLAIVGIGAITTILISIKSIAPSGDSAIAITLSLWVGILAIIFSSLGTATSALNSFYGPRESYLKSERSLAALRQLHSDIAAKATSGTDVEHPDKCLKVDPSNKDDPTGKQLQDWAAKLSAILNATDSGSSSSQGTSSSGSAGAPKGTAPAPAQ